MDISKDIIEKYAKKIYGFAFSKTRNYDDAQDLSQEILATLFEKGTKFSQIENIDAYIFRICSYTWMNYYRKDILKRKNLENASMLDFIEDETDIERDYIDNELYEKLRQEIMYLSKTKREVIIMYYYENKSSKEISEKLNITASSVRWYLGESKKTLKERIEMKEENGIYTPIKLSISHNGSANDYNMGGLQNDILMQNIAYLCYQKPMTIEEIARTLSVAAIYLEDKIEKLLWWDYIKKVGSKYQTNFFMETDKMMIKNHEFWYENVKNLYTPIIKITDELKSELEEKSVLFGEYSDNLLKWSLLMPVINLTVGYFQKIVSEKLNLTFTYPKRKDGGEHFVSASLYDWSDDLQQQLSSNKKLKEFTENSGGCGVKTRCAKSLASLQYDISFFGGGWREFDGVELNQISRVYEIITNGETPNEYDKDAIANLVSKGYCKMDNGSPKLLVPYVKNIDNSVALLWNTERMNKLIEKHFSKEQIEQIIDLFCKHINKMRGYIPDFLEDNIKNEALCKSFFGNYPILYYIYKNGYVEKPLDDELVRVCTLVCELPKE